MKPQSQTQFNSSANHRILYVVITAAHGLKTSVKLAINFLTFNIFDPFRSASAIIHRNTHLYFVFHLYLVFVITI